MELLPLRLMFRFVYKWNVGESTRTRQRVGGPFEINYLQIAAYRSERSMLGEETLEHVLASLAYAIHKHLGCIFVKCGCFVSHCYITAIQCN